MMKNGKTRTFDALIEAFKEYGVTIVEQDVKEWFAIVHPDIIDYILDEQGISVTNGKVFISTIHYETEPDLVYVKCKLRLLRDYINENKI